MRNTFFIDECLSPELVAYARSRNIEAVSPQSRNLIGVKDWKLLPYVIDSNLILATCNVKDFFRLYAQEELHPGFVVILPGELRIKEQLKLFGLVLDRIDHEEDQHLVNKVLIVDKDGKISIVDWSKNNTNSQLPPGL